MTDSHNHAKGVISEGSEVVCAFIYSGVLYMSTSCLFVSTIFTDDRCTESLSPPAVPCDCWLLFSSCEVASLSRLWNPFIQNGEEEYD